LQILPFFANIAGLLQILAGFCKGYLGPFADAVNGARAVAGTASAALDSTRQDLKDAVGLR
jgi:hypothetical protein